MCADRVNATSQNGEDALIEAAVDRLGITHGTCVEFGAWDGKKNSNTYNLIANRGWSGVLIEADAERFKALAETYSARPDVVTLNRIVGFDSPDTLDEILAGTPLPTDFDLLVVDIDGCDYHVFEAMKVYRPKIVIVEFNHSIPNEYEFVQPRDLGVNQGSSLLSITKLAWSKGYDLIATLVCNAFYVRRDLYPVLGVPDNTLHVLHGDTSCQTHIAQLYDGTLILLGCNRLIWREPVIKIEVAQFPEALRKFPDALKGEVK